MAGEHAVGRVIARPFTGAPGSFRRTAGRRDFALVPSGRSYLEALGDAGVPVHGVGKISDLFAGVGVAHSHPGASNEQALASTAALLREIDEGLVFVNLIETDQVYGHRKDARGFADALARIDAAVGEMLAGMRTGDLLVVSADHGVDPDHGGTDHTREYAPLLAATVDVLERGGARHDGALADVGATVLRWLAGGEDLRLPGSAFIS
jgi:phosphopentomutase